MKRARAGALAATSAPSYEARPQPGETGPGRAGPGTRFKPVHPWLLLGLTRLAHPCIPPSPAAAAVRTAGGEASGAGPPSALMCPHARARPLPAAAVT